MNSTAPALVDILPEQSHDLVECLLKPVQSALRSSRAHSIF
jgi:hypothetical protein